MVIHRIAREVFPSQWLKKGSTGDDDDSPLANEHPQVVRRDTTPEPQCNFSVN